MNNAIAKISTSAGLKVQDADGNLIVQPTSLETILTEHGSLESFLDNLCKTHNTPHVLVLHGRRKGYDANGNARFRHDNITSYIPTQQAMNTNNQHANPSGYPAPSGLHGGLGMVEAHKIVNHDLLVNQLASVQQELKSAQIEIKNLEKELQDNKIKELEKDRDKPSLGEQLKSIMDSKAVTEITSMLTGNIAGKAGALSGADGSLPEDSLLVVQALSNPEITHYGEWLKAVLDCLLTENENFNTELSALINKTLQ